jgi:hypothetical protein
MGKGQKPGRGIMVRRNTSNTQKKKPQRSRNKSAPNSALNTIDKKVRGANRGVGPIDNPNDPLLPAAVAPKVLKQASGKKNKGVNPINDPNDPPLPG